MGSLTNPLQIVTCADKASESRGWILLATKQGALAGCPLQLEEANSF
jgi:hypothetical protein